MRERYEKLVFGFLAVLCLWTSSAEAKDYKLYYLGGQSNMDGFGYVKDLQGQNAEPVKGVMMFHGNQGLDCQPESGQGLWAELRPGNGTGFTSDGMKNTYSDRFGVELSFARRLRELDPDSNIAISTDEYSYSDPWHYDSAGYLDLGEKFADAVNARNSRRN